MKNLLQKTNILLIVLVLSIGLGFSSVSIPKTNARSLSDLQQEATDLEKKIEKSEEKAGQLANKAESLEKTIKSLDVEIQKANAQIKLTDIRIEKLEKELAVAQEKLDQQKDMLKANMRALYIRGGVSTVELLVSADSFSAFIDEQEYLERLKETIQESTVRVLEIKQDIQAKKNKQEKLKIQQEAQRELVRRAKTKQAELLRDTRGDELRFRERSENLQKKQAKILSEIVSRSQVISGLGTGSYPWANYRKGNWTHAGSCNYGNDHDPWGYCYRQCTSFVAWRLYSTGKNPPKYYGDATNWAARAKANGVSTGSVPKVGSVAMWNGSEGHVSYVEEVRSDGRVRVSEYNAVPALKGLYSQRIIYPDDPATYIYFD